MKQYIKATEEYDPEAAFSADSSTRRKIARSTNSQELLEVYRYDPDTSVRNMLARNVNAPIELLQAIIDDPNISTTVKYEAEKTLKYKEIINRHTASLENSEE